MARVEEAVMRENRQQEGERNNVRSGEDHAAYAGIGDTASGKAAEDWLNRGMATAG